MDRIERYQNELAAKAIERIKIIPKILWVVFALAIVLIFQKEIKSKIKETTKFKNSIIEINFKDRIDDFNKITLDGNERKRLLSRFNKPQQDSLIDRVKRLEYVLNNNTFRLLWLDDEPTFSTMYVAPLLEEIGFICDYAETSNTALNMIQRTIIDVELNKYDIIVTDFSRPADSLGDGLFFADSANQLVPKVPIIMYTYSYDKKYVPRSLFGLTHEAYSFINLVLDAIERRSIK